MATAPKPAAKPAAPKPAAAKPAAPARATVKAPEPEPEPQVEEQPAEEQAAATELTVYDHLLDAAKAVKADFAPKHAKEQVQDFYKRMVLVLADMSDEIWASLPEEAQLWFNAATEAVNGNAEVAELPGFAEANPAPAAAAPKAGGKGNTAGLEAYRAKRAAEKAAGIAPTPKAPAAPKEPRQPSVTSYIRKEVCADPDADLATITKRLEEKGHKDIKASTLSTIRGDTLATLAALKELGKLK